MNISRGSAEPAGLRGIPVREVLDLPAMAGGCVLAGAAGLDRMVRFVNVMEVPDVLPWTRADELLLTTGYPLRSTPEAWVDHVRDLDDRRLAGLAVKLGRYVDDLPEAMLASADQRGFPVLQVPDGVGFDEVINQVLTEVLGRQAAVLARGEQAHAELLQLVLRGGGVQEVADALVGQLAGDAADRTGPGRTGTEPGRTADIAVPAGITVLHVDRTGSRTVTAGDPLPPAVHTALFDPDGLFRTTRYDHGVHRPLPRSSASALVASVAAEGDLGRFVAVRSDRPWDGWDLITVERAATVAALVITRDLAVAAVERKYRGDFLRDVLVGRVTADQAVGQARGFEWDLTGPLVVVVAAFDGRADEDATRRRRAEQLAASWATFVRRWDPQAAAATFATEAVAVLHCPDRSVPDTGRISELVGGLAWRGSTFDGHVGTSRVVDDAESLPRAYAQAWEAVRVGRRLADPGAVSRFDDLGLYRLLSLVPDSAELRSFLADTLGPLAVDEGDQEADELRRTLTVLLDTNLNVAQTARRLHFHYNTLRYRIGKLERMLGPFTTDARLRADLTVALHVWHMRVAHG